LMNVEGWQPWGELMSSDVVPHDPPAEPAAEAKMIHLPPPGIVPAVTTEAEVHH
jgi:hypothetical protein